MKAYDYFIKTKQNVNTFLLWYKTSSIGHRNFVWLFIGCFCGYIYGKIEYNNKKKGKGIYGDLICVDEYIINKKNIMNFEKNYNKLNIHAFKNRGYEYTKLFKAINWENSPLSYLQLRLWKNQQSYDNYLKNKQVNELFDNVKKECTSYTSNIYETIVDDSIIRIIQ
ncbi:conserved Plasmodium protein, unknown function [Plasmodium berghei]|uniref:Uncharacterized protein n=2 Tax=Plasmodium berghei TaxID=5821 RepID=A0A509AEZ2_PLABA|nr:conserved protein, unknown function [Plasmodium berghei ANKA]CXH95067.1 conserved Plasmodium protein, unknown function [Plasmodium berghei]SCL90980.1 conserved Plasmodium protein, unknown function [Plasmodium berghei]SCM15398.1 conserved Plasmodium protein, unknown function [Plasmodium berghei]SCM17192.1 conserved Plasmodium protein, unknown function [Plasmodium berghei]SCN22243.1 conserved Plasmodium protein, unknown function [Plasmodium berghei]|eukprot:XP_034419982.1 conserved protein, unknown function [Plasmodium berghei ANKA]